MAIIHANDLQGPAEIATAMGIPRKLLVGMEGLVSGALFRAKQSPSEVSAGQSVSETSSYIFTTLLGVLINVAVSVENVILGV